MYVLLFKFNIYYLIYKNHLTMTVVLKDNKTHRHLPICTKNFAYLKLAKVQTTYACHDRNRGWSLIKVARMIVVATGNNNLYFAIRKMKLNFCTRMGLHQQKINKTRCAYNGLFENTHSTKILKWHQNRLNFSPIIRYLHNSKNIYKCKIF